MDDNPKQHRRHDDNNDDEDGDDVDGSISTNLHSNGGSQEEGRRKKKRDRKKRESKSKKEKRHRKTKISSKDKKLHKKDKKRKRRVDDTSMASTSSYDTDHDMNRRKRKIKQNRKESKKQSGHDDDFESQDQLPSTTLAVAHSLHVLLSKKPEFASDLSIILIRLAGGTTFDLRQVTDQIIARGLQNVFEALEPFGVTYVSSTGNWMFQPPASSGRRDEMVLLRVIRSLLDDAGLTMAEIEKFDQQRDMAEKEQMRDGIETREATAQDGLTTKDKAIKHQTIRLLSEFQTKDSELGAQLIGLCRTIAEGESISLDGLSDQKLKNALENLFDACGLEKSEMEVDEDDKDDDAAVPPMGYGMPEVANDTVSMKLATIMAACREGPPKRCAIGPMRRPTTEEEEREASTLYADSSKVTETGYQDEEDEGPMMPREAKTFRVPTLPPEVIRAQAEHRGLEFKAITAGIDMPVHGGREEWMVVPGKYDFLSGIKSGQPMKSRGFQNQKSTRDDDIPAKPIHPAVEAEIQAIMEAHRKARGPSLMDQHRAMKRKQASSSVGTKKDWKWKRDKDLDAGRRVDKDALGMILGGAADNLKTKFQGGFNR